MSDLIKISEVSLKYDISTRALRYYEDAGLIESVRTLDYAYRLYDDKTIKKLEQILVLRKLNISIKDIQKIFLYNKVDVLIDVLSQKLDGIEEEVLLLNQLKEIVLTFIKQLETCEGMVEMNLQLLYKKANSIHVQIDESNHLADYSVANLFISG